jgi:uncharacterized protein (TIGR00369 family)
LGSRNFGKVPSTIDPSGHFKYRWKVVDILSKERGKMAEYEELSANFKAALMKKTITESPFLGLLGMELLDVKKGWAKIRMPFDRKLTQARGIAHGGAIYSLADSAVAMALLGMVERDEAVTTVEQKINYIKSFSSGELTAEASIINKGKKIAVGDTEVRDSDGNLVAKCTATFMILQKRV